MKIDFSTKLFDLNGEAIRVDEKADARQAELRDIVMAALNVPAQGDGVDRRVRLFRLMCKIKDGGTLEIDPEDASIAKEKVAATPYSTTIVGTALDLLNG